MSLLRIHCRLLEEPLRLRWVLVDRPIDGSCQPVDGEGTVSDLPKSARHTQLIIPAGQVLLTHARLPNPVERWTGSMLAFAVEEGTLPEPEANYVSHIGRAGEHDVLAVVDKKGLQHCLDALNAEGIYVEGIYCETLLLPWAAGQWAVAWDGREGFVRTGEFEGAAIDCGDAASPPLALHLMLEGEERSNTKPTSILLYTIAGKSESETEAEKAVKALVTSNTPDIESWQRKLRVPVTLAGEWDWRLAVPPSGARLAHDRKRWQSFSGLLPRLRTAACVVAVVMVLHALALIADWALLAHEQRTLRQQMEARFRGIFPAAVAVVDPVLQMRRKLVEARHEAGLPDDADFLPMIEIAGAGLSEFAPDAVRAVSYDNGKMTLELAIDLEMAQRIAARLQQTGLSVEITPVSSETGSGAIVLNVRTS